MAVKPTRPPTPVWGSSFEVQNDAPRACCPIKVAGFGSAVVVIDVDVTF